MELVKFEVRCYEKGELAQLYFPYLPKKAAGQKLRRWMQRCALLTKELETISYNLNNRYFSAREVRLIVYYLGEP